MSKLSADQIVELIEGMNISQTTWQLHCLCGIASSPNQEATKADIAPRLSKEGLKFSKTDKVGVKKSEEFFIKDSPVFRVLVSKFILTNEAGSKVFKLNADLSESEIQLVKEACHKRLN